MRAATRRCCSKAVTAARRGRSTRACGTHPTRATWQPGGGGLCLHTIVPWPGDPNRLSIGISAVGVMATDDGGRSWRHVERPASCRATCRRISATSSTSTASTASPEPPAGPSGCSCSSTAACTAPTTRASPGSTSQPVCRRTSASRSRSTRPTRTARTSSRSPRTWTASPRAARCGSTRRATRGRRGRHAATDCPIRRLPHGPARGIYLRRRERRARALLRCDIGRRVRLRRRRAHVVQRRDPAPARVLGQTRRLTARGIARPHPHADFADWGEAPEETAAPACTSNGSASSLPAAWLVLSCRVSRPGRSNPRVWRASNRTPQAQISRRRQRQQQPPAIE